MTSHPPPPSQPVQKRPRPKRSRNAARKKDTTARGTEKHAKPKRRTQKKQPLKQPRRPGFARRAAFLAVLAAMIGGPLLFLYNDAGVARRLRTFNPSNVPIILSSPLDITAVVSRLSSSDPRTLERLREILSDRRYGEVPTPDKPGEFSLTTENLTVVTREFTAANGTQYPAQTVRIPLKATADTAARNGTSTLLEPHVIAYLGSGDLRASTFTPLAQIPLHVQHAVLATEDRRFYDHFGIDLIGITRAMLTNLLALRLVQGGSSLTQQLAKNLFLSPKRTVWRKLAEIPTALSLERHLSKQQLLELYLNEVYLGQEGAIAVHGFPEAAQAFFGKRIEDLAVEEAAVLAGAIKAPSYFNPRKHPERALKRRNIVLGKMAEYQFISEQQHTAALARPLTTTTQQHHRRIAPFFSSALEEELSTSLDLEAARGSGLTVYTGLDLGMQRCAEAAVTSGIARLEKKHPRLSKHTLRLEAALVALDPHSGLVRAWIGGRDFHESQFNRVNQGMRQIGSTVKPFLYLSALDGSLNSYKVASPISVLEDKPMAITARNRAAWVPENFDRDFRGDVSLRYALEHSLNMPAIYVAQRIGVATLKRTLEAFQVAAHTPAVPALALGALDTSLLRLTSAYGALATLGVHTTPRLYVSALDGAGARLSATTLAERRVADERAVFVLTDILQGVLARGSGTGARTAGFTRPAAGKTGTSDKTRDAWFVGYTPSLVVGVWVGFDDNTPTGLSGGGAAAPIWGDFMHCSEPFIPDLQFLRPDGVQVVAIDARTGELATPECPSQDTIEEVFVSGTEPTRSCHEHGDSTTEAPTDERRYPSGEEPQPSWWDRVFG